MATLAVCNATMAMDECMIQTIGLQVPATANSSASLAQHQIARIAFPTQTLARLVPCILLSLVLQLARLVLLTVKLATQQISAVSAIPPS